MRLDLLLPFPLACRPLVDVIVLVRAAERDSHLLCEALELFLLFVEIAVGQVFSDF